MQHTDKVGILPGEQIQLTLVQSVTIAANYTASGNTPFCERKTRRGALESSRTSAKETKKQPSLEEGYAARGKKCANRSALV